MNNKIVFNDILKIILTAVLIFAVLIYTSFLKKCIGSSSYTIPDDEIVKVIDSSCMNCNGLVHISGFVKNISDIDNVKVIMVIELWDKNKNVIKSIELTEDDLDSGDIWRFDTESFGKKTEYYCIKSINAEY